MRKFITLVADAGELFISLVEGEKIMESISASYDKEGGREALFKATKDAIEALISRHGLTDDDISYIYSSAHAASADRLFAIACLETPLTLRDMREDAYETKYKEIANIPFVQVRGLRKRLGKVLDFNFLEARGAECELLGLECGAGIYVIAGAEYAIITVSEDGSIVDLDVIGTQFATAERLKAYTGSRIFIGGEQTHKKMLSKIAEISGIKAELLPDISPLEAATRGLIRIANE